MSSYLDHGELVDALQVAEKRVLELEHDCKRYEAIIDQLSQKNHALLELCSRPIDMLSAIRAREPWIKQNPMTCSEVEP